MLLFFVLFFGIGFILNMLLRMTWIMGIIYPIIAILIIDNVRFAEYFTNSGDAFQKLGVRLSSLHPSDITILSFGFLGALASGAAMKMLRSKGYRMF
jgi:hypothetical protein